MGACLAKEGGADCFDCLDDKADFGDVEGGVFKGGNGRVEDGSAGEGRRWRLGKRGRIWCIFGGMRRRPEAMNKRTLVVSREEGGGCNNRVECFQCGLWSLLEFGEIELVEIIEQACGSGVVVGVERGEGGDDGWPKRFLWSDWDIRERGRLGSVAWLR
ncbi:hypothetical protein BC829DRAFT_415744 [Chytridium lagenaria]|nr:hypothetical protein BC829DRAFT_415744 [Chytridium lagenaria]